MKYLIKLARPKHWVKNLLIFAPLFFSQQVSLEHFQNNILAFIAFSLTASSIYILNDIVDAPKDRKHPEKKNRPLAAQKVSVQAAIVEIIIFLCISAAISSLLPKTFWLVLTGYTLLNVAYSYGLKSLLIIDVMILAAGFVMRILAGGFTADVPVSHWIIICTFFGALFLGFGKRKNETMLLQEDSHNHRKVLLHYTKDFLNQLMGLTAGMTIISYSLYTIDPQNIAHFQTENLFYTIPFVVYGIFRYFHILYNKTSGGDPTKIFLRDLPMVINVLLWIASLFLILRWN